MKNVALYARISQDEQSAYSLPTQLDACRQYAAEHGCVVVSEFQEDYTGASYDRPELDRIKTLAQSGAIDGIVVYVLDRFARGMAKQIILESDFKKLGVSLVTATAEYADTPEGRFQKNVRAAVAELERELIIERTNRGRRGRAESGKVIGGGCAKYGFRYISKRDNGVGSLEFVADEIAVVRDIYQWYTGPERLTIHQIGDRLTVAKVPTRYDKLPTTTRKGKPSKRIKSRKAYGVWNDGTISRILRDETYAGTWHYNKTDQAGGGHFTKKDKAEWIAVKIDPAIDRETWEKAQQRIQENAWRSQHQTKHPYLMRGRLKCADCGRAFNTHTEKRRKLVYLYYECKGQKRDCTSTREAIICHGYVVAADIDQAVWEYVSGQLKHPARIRRNLRQRMQRQDHELTSVRERIKTAEAEIADRIEQQKELLAERLHGKIRRDVIDDMAEKLNAEIASFQVEVSGLKAQLDRPEDISDGDFAKIMDHCARIADGIDKFTFEERLEVMDALHVTAVVKRGNPLSVAVSCYLSVESTELQLSPRRSVGQAHRRHSSGQARTPASRCARLAPYRRTSARRG